MSRWRPRPTAWSPSPARSAASCTWSSSTPTASAPPTPSCGRSTVRRGDTRRPGPAGRHRRRHRSTSGPASATSTSTPPCCSATGCPRSTSSPTTTWRLGSGGARSGRAAAASSSTSGGDAGRLGARLGRGPRSTTRSTSCRGAAHYGGEGNPRHPRRPARRTRASTGCGSGPTAPRRGAAQPRLAERHMAVLVGGLGSSTRRGRHRRPRHRRPGLRRRRRLPVLLPRRHRPPTVDAVRARPTPPPTLAPARPACLREYLQATAAAHPGVPIDVIAHSQGGLVAREALTNEYDGLDPTLPQVSSLVTLATPPPGRRPGHRRRHARRAPRSATCVERGDQPGRAVRHPGRRRCASCRRRRRSSATSTAGPCPRGCRATSIGGRGRLRRARRPHPSSAAAER